MVAAQGLHRSGSSPEELIPSGWSHQVAEGDFNADGHKDAVVLAHPTDTTNVLAIYFGSYYLSEYSGVGFSFDRFPAVIVAFSINYAAYFAEIFRGGIQSIPKGQYEAAYMLGLTRTQTFFRIILPQVVKRVVPASANEVITLVKDTSLAQVIAVTELFALAKKQQAAYASIYPLFVAGVFYYVANLLLSVFFAYVERKLDYYK